MANYNSDFYGWTQEQAALLRAGRFTDIDVENLIEEVETMGRSEKRAVESRLTVVLLHLLKWKYQPDRRCTSWKISMDLQRKQFQKILSENPGLKSQIQTLLNDAYDQARYEAYTETGIDLGVFPAECPWAYDQVCDSGFYPD
jgi:hypothetical protein